MITWSSSKWIGGVSSRVHSTLQQCRWDLVGAHCNHRNPKVPRHPKNSETSCRLSWNPQTWPSAKIPQMVYLNMFGTHMWPHQILQNWSTPVTPGLYFAFISLFVWSFIFGHAGVHEPLCSEIHHLSSSLFTGSWDVTRLCLVEMDYSMSRCPPCVASSWTWKDRFVQPLGIYSQFVAVLTGKLIW